MNNSASLPRQLALASCLLAMSEITPAQEPSELTPAQEISEITPILEVANDPFKIGSGDRFHLTGYVRTWSAFNLQDHPETPPDDRYDASMLRGSLLLDGELNTGPFQWKAVGRLDREYMTNDLKRLEDMGATGGGSGRPLRDTYNQEELREWTVSFGIGDRLRFRLGKQQVVWGETDFFRALDVVHGFDYRWRSFLEAENEDLRKPLILLNTMIQIPEANGGLQLLVRPGWDRDRDIGNTYDLSGGRWANQPNKGVDFLGVMDYDYHNPNGDTDDVTGGVRWSAATGSGLKYSLAYLKTFNNDPVVNTADPAHTFGRAPSGLIGDFIYPEVDVFGLTLSNYSAKLDAVLSSELVYTRDAAFNVGTSPASNIIGLPGFAGIKLKDTITTMVRMDKTVNIRPLHTSRPSFLSFQLFDTWTLHYDRAEDLVQLAGYAAPRPEHVTILTSILAMNYRNDRINPSIAAGVDLGNGGGFFIPAIEFAYGDNWRLKAEVDLFFNNGRKQRDTLGENTYLFGYFANNNQLTLRLTRQF